MKAIGTEVGFEFDLYRVSLRAPRVTRRGRGVIVDNQDYSVWPSPGYAVRVTSSPDYQPGEVVHVCRASLRS